MKDLLLIDTNAIFHRSRSALTRTMGEMTTSWGMPVTGTFGSLNTIFSVLEKGDYDCVVPCYDAGGNFRKKLSEDYKGTRVKSSDEHYADIDLLVRDILPSLGFNPVGIKGWECDDIIATISRNAPAYREIHILTVDKDLLQLVGNRVKVILFNSAKKVEVVDIDGVLSHFGVYPSEVKYYKALAGDSSDNVAGIKGIGPKTAVRIIQESRPTEAHPEFTGADKICLHPKVAPHAGVFLGNLRLVSLDQDVPDLTWLASSPPAVGSLFSVFEQLEFRSFLKDSRLKKIRKALKIPEVKNA